MRGKKVEFLQNEKHGRLTVIKSLNKSLRVGKRGIRKIWLFRCDCGNEVECFGSDVKSGRKQSCGCLLKEHRSGCGERIGKLLTKPDKDGPLTKLFGTYNRQSIRRGYDWCLTKQDFRDLISKNCFYCGCEPSTEICIARHKNKNNTLIYNGVDRINNKIGYTKENSVTACFICNRMKMDLDYDIFIRQVKKINETQNL